MQPIYLDNQATTRCDPRVLDAMMPYFCEDYGNASSKTHSYGWTAEAAVDLARERVATALGANASEVVFCSGATEANHLAIHGIALSHVDQGKHLVVAATEHPSVLESARVLQRRGYTLSILSVEPDGRVAPGRLLQAITPTTVLVSIMLVNNEIGVIQAISELSMRVKEKNPNTVVHCDAAQALGKIPINVGELGVDLLTVSGHKVYGPKGVGALWRRRRPRLSLEPVVPGGGQEWGLRGGTLPVPLIVGLGMACELATAEWETEHARIRRQAKRLLSGLQDALGEVMHVNGSLEHRIPGNLNVSFAGVNGDELILAARQVAFSTGSACASQAGKPSHVLQALGDAQNARQAVRFGIGRFTSDEQIEICIHVITGAVKRLRKK